MPLTQIRVAVAHSGVLATALLAPALSSIARAAEEDLNGARALVRAAVEQMFGGRNPALADRFVAEDYIEHNPRLTGGRTGVITYLERMHTAFPGDFHAEITQTLGEDDRVLVFIRWHGLQNGTFNGAAPTGKEITWVTADIWRVQDGKLAEHWDVVDRMDRDLALGLVVHPK